MHAFGFEWLSQPLSLTACDGPSWGNAPGFGMTVVSGGAGEGTRAPFGWEQEWSKKRVLISGLDLGFLQS